ncbi:MULTISPECIES: DUF308 domain-containing protein [Kocuria]|uniref:DUF308 domain-containing protein n=1 Tax=Kocuria TaxID=57493 RepID=UPI00203D074A|nr:MULTISPECIES: DUF308 domain-containing protein [Kocuria]MCM3687594.1 DUF308 domain-containing protein [Kocuria rosea]HST71250.1 DUF308 domain-containing protein [Kocuria rosea]
MIPDPSTGIHRDLFAPTLLRALVALAFGAVTIFWQQPSLAVVAWGVGLYLLLTGAASVFLQLRLNGNDHVDMGPSRQVPQSYGVLYAVGGILTVLGGDTASGLVLYAALIMGVAGLTELALGLKFRTGFPLGRDWTIAGLVTVLAATGLVLVVDLGAKALFGVVGGAAVVIGVAHLLAALTLRHEDRQGRAPAGTA